MAFINRWKISRNWERNAKASDFVDLNIFTSNLDSDIEAYLITAYDLKREFLKVPLLNERTNILSRFSYAVPSSPKKTVIGTPFKLVKTHSKILE